MINENGLLNIFPTAEASGSIVSFENGADGIPMESLSVAVEPIQDLHGYDHPWPGGGGVNKLLPSETDRTNSLNGLDLSYDAATETFSISGTNTKTDAAWFIANWNYTVVTIPTFTAGETWYYSSNLQTGLYSQLTYKNTSNQIKSLSGQFDGTGVFHSKSFIIPDDFSTFANMQIGCFKTTGAIASATDIVFELSQTQPSSWTPYANICPISGRTGLSVYVSPTTAQADATTYSVDWTTQAGTVYGGTLDVTTGVLTVDRVLYTYTGNESVSARSGLYIPVKLGASGIYVTNDVICTDFEYVRVGANGWSYIQTTMTPAEVQTYLQNHTVSIVCELATPLTYQLTAQEVATLLGLNRVWSDAGDISLVYHTQVDATPSSIDGLFINGEGLQADGWFLKWRKLAAPKPKTDYVSVWGRDGDIDLTESETDGQVFYENRELTMDMVYMGEDWTDAYSELLDMLHGKECAVQFSNDPYWYWAGRIIASLYEHKPHSLTMSGIMFPYKLSVAKVTKSVTVSGAIESNGVEVVLPSSRMRVSPKVTVVAGTGESVTLKWGTKTQTLSAGTYYVRGLKVGSDDVTIKVWGTGTVTFEYRKGML